MIDLDAFEERAAILEYDAGLSRFEAETLAVRAQQTERWKVLDEIRKRNSAEGWHLSQVARELSENNLPRVQPHQKEEKR